MAPIYLPRVGAFPIFAENHPLTVAAASTELPLTVRKDFPLKDQLAPDFTLTDQTGKLCSLHATIELGRPIILFFFPLAGSPHCTKESCLFRDAIQITPIFNALQAIVIGISQDSPSRAKRFSQEHQLTYRILHDDKRKVMDAYSVGRNMFGMVDNRATFIIDPSGIIRGMAEGVLNSMGHLKFAEKWLIRLEHELSERSRYYLEYAGKEGDMIASMETMSGKMIQVVYGEEGSARHGGIDGVPRYGATSLTQVKPIPPTLPNTARRRKSFDQEKIYRSRLEKQEKLEAGGSLEDKNMWRGWKNLLSQLSSPDGVPPPLVNHQGRNESGKVEEVDLSINGSAGSSPSLAKRKTNTLPRRTKSPFGKRLSRSNGKATPPFPLPPSPSPALNGKMSNGKTHQSDSLDADNEDFKMSWGTDTSHSVSGLSTAPSSVDHRRVGSQSSRKSANPVRLSASGSSSNGHNNWKATPQNAKPSVTSEILMADSPVITRAAPSTTSLTPSPSTNHFFLQQVKPKSNGSPGVQEILPLPRRSVGPSDVPEDAKPDEEEFVTPSSLVSALSTAMLQIPNRRSPTPSSLAGSKGMDRNGSSNSSTGRKNRKVQPPVVNSQYGPQSWDATYISLSNDGHDGLQSSGNSDLTARSFHSNSSYRQRPRSRTLTTTSVDETISPLNEAMSPSSPELPSVSHPYSNGRLSRSSSITQIKANGHLSERQRTPTNSSVISGASLVLQSLSPANVSQASLHGSVDGIAVSPISIVESNSYDSNKIRLIPRKAPPPMYAPPQPPNKEQEQEPRQGAATPTREHPIIHSNTTSTEPSDQQYQQQQQQQRHVNPLTLIASRSSSSGHGRGNSPSNTFISSFPPSSRRASTAESFQSAGTFG